ncbi:unnamed protein product [Protopolystoma xenopodis]|uniref:Ku C-terminal domain-containing protein n=1 Tax=Protopolystoma xenopodis TaxID=117903 RepID=A0A3S5BP46_9PLAT|nr:unnamed protein product [Protopolystoma xenopodis]
MMAGLENEHAEPCKKQRQTTVPDFFNAPSSQCKTLLGSNKPNIHISPEAEGLVCPSELLVLSVGNVNPVGDFRQLLEQRKETEACEQMNYRIFKFVTDPYTAWISRSKTRACIRVYRQAACLSSAFITPSICESSSGSRQLVVAKAYNQFLHDFRRKIESQPYVVQASADPTTALDKRSLLTAFWQDVIVKENLSLITETEMPGIGVSSEESTEFIRLFQPDLSVGHKS